MATSEAASAKRSKGAGVTVLQLIPKGALVIPGLSGEILESRRVVINNKLLDTGVRLLATPKLEVLISEDDAREVLSLLYNDIWDCLLVHGKAATVDAKVVFSLPSHVQTDAVFSAGPVLHPTCFAESRSLAEHVKDEAESAFVLYDNPRHVAEYRRKKVALGGTFDRFHVGHKKLLSVALQCAEELVIVGVTSDVMLMAKKNRKKIQSLDERLQHVKDFMATSCPPSLKYEIVVIDDPFGPTVSMPELDGIVCSSETLKGALAVNTERAKRNYSPLLPILVLRSNVYALSSTFIRDRLAL